MASNQESIQLLSRLTAIKSYSSEEEDISKFISEWCAHEDLPFQNIDGNILVSYGNDLSLKHLLLNAHMDVVSGKNWNNPVFPLQSPFEPQIANQRMYGRGTADTKSGLAAMLLTARNLLKNRSENTDLRGLISFLFTRAEEDKAMFNGVRRVLQGNMIPTPTAALIAEPSNLEVLLGSGGIFSFSLEETSKNSEVFDSTAINADLLIQSADRIKKEFPVIDRLLLFQLVLNVVMMNGSAISEITCSSEGFSFRPEKLTVKLNEIIDKSILLFWADRIEESGELIFETNNPELIGHPAYANYHPGSMKLVEDIFGAKYLPFTCATNEAINIMLFRAEQKLRTNISQVETLFAPLPNFEFTSLVLKDGDWQVNVSCRTSPEVDNTRVTQFINQVTSKLKVTSSAYRNAIYTDQEAEIATISAKIVQQYFGKQSPIAVQLGASDGQVMRDILPSLPIILLSAGSGTLTKPGSIDQAPKYLSTSHQPDEFVDLNQFIALPSIYLRIILEYLK